MLFLDVMRECVLKRVDALPSVASNSAHTATRIDTPQPGIIAEIKFSSPSAGKLYTGSLNHIAIARSYLNAGASALSVLTEPSYFHGNMDYLRDIRQAFPDAYLLMKDFILSKKQIYQGAQAGANAILLIVAFLSVEELKSLYAYALSLNLTPLIEVHSCDELDIAMTLDPKMIGINNRNLKTLEIDLDISRQLIERIPEHVYTVCESGIKSSGDIDEMGSRAVSTGFIKTERNFEDPSAYAKATADMSTSPVLRTGFASTYAKASMDKQDDTMVQGGKLSRGFDAFLIGSHFMTHADPGKALSEFIKGANHEG